MPQVQTRMAQAGGFPPPLPQSVRAEVASGQEAEGGKVMTNPRCGHCGGYTTLKSFGTDQLHYVCTTKGCRCYVLVRRSGEETNGPCLSMYRDGLEPHGTKELPGETPRFWGVRLGLAAQR